jgi:hypothetical protein
LLEELPPQLVFKDLRDSEHLAATGAPINKHPPEYERVRSALHGFYPDSFNLAYTLFHLSHTDDRAELAQQYLEVAQAAAWHKHEKALVARAIAKRLAR